MAVIRTHKQKVFGKWEQFKIIYTAKFKRFEIKLPKEMEDFCVSSGTSAPHASTESELMTALEKFLDVYEKASVTQRKVLAYQMDWSSNKIKSHLPGSHYSKHHSNSDEARIEFIYHVLIEKEVGGNKRYYQEGTRFDLDTRKNVPSLDNPDNSFDDHKATIIEWTAEREAFLKSIYSGMEDLMKKLKKFVGTEKLLLNAVNQNLKLLEMKSEWKDGDMA